MQKSWMKTRQTQYSIYLTVYLIVILGVLGAANWLANRYVKTHDFTSNKRFSLADQTIKVVKGLKNDVKITYFDNASGFQRGKDLLDRYDNLSTKLSVEYVDPDKKPQMAKAYGIRATGTTFVEAGSKREEARSLSEEEVTSALIRVLKTGERLVCANTGSGEHSFDNTDRSGYSRFKELLEKNNYKTRSIKLIEKPEVPKECTILIIGGPRFDYQAVAVEAINTYLRAGGKVLIALDPPMQVGKETVSDNEPLVKLLEKWGIMLQKNLIIDTSGVGALFNLSEVIPLVTSYESHVIVRDMKESATAFPLARSLEIKAVGDITPEKLFSTSSNSYATENLSSPEIKLNPAKDKKGPFILAAAAAVNLAAANDQLKPRYIAVGSSSFMANNFLGFNGNRDLSMNMINWLSADEDLISIRPKDPMDRRLSINRTQMRFILYSSVFMLPLLVIGAGLSVWWKRR